jgi:TolA-binding protein
MMHAKIAVLVLLLTSFGLCASFADDLNSAIDLFRDGQYEKAIPILRSVIANPAASTQKPDAYLLLAKSQMAVGKLDDADKSIEYYLASYQGAADYPEAVYQKGRLLFLQEQYEQSIQVLQSFLSTYQASPLVSSAWFWVGEDLYNLGHIEDARKIYQKILTDFPSSVKVEAARYKVSLIQLQKKEIELERLLKWSHEDFLKSLEEFRQREKTYEQAIEAYQKRLSGGNPDQDQKTIADLRAELAKRTAEAQDLSAKLSQLGAAPAAGEPGAASGPAASEGPPQGDLQRRERLLALKEQALALKERYLAALEAAEAAK